MSATSLVSFDAGANAVSAYNPKMKTTTVRLLTAKEFKKARGLKGNAASLAYNAYIREHGQASTAGLAAALTSGELLVRSYRDGRASVGVSFIKKSAIKDPKSKSADPLSEATAEQLRARLAQLEALTAKSAAAAAPAPAAA